MIGRRMCLGESFTEQVRYTRYARVVVVEGDYYRFDNGDIAYKYACWTVL